ncbi:hypothetical protein WJU16_05915 [Chitinophaga pollutisoli]|uniref:Transmembrane protein n=1 Tax=Chitinophaga pollutisoli TaxID=3133966 RepID=A0ABZ2YSW5_9BACT
MKNFKLSFALVIAILAVGVTVATNANAFGKRAITACFEQVVLKNLVNATTLDPLAYQAANPTLTCAQVKTHILTTTGNVWLSANPASVRFDCTPNQAKFCCVQFEVQSTYPGNSIPSLTIGSQTGYFYIPSASNILCKPSI